jgi:hypothetical protein
LESSFITVVGYSSSFFGPRKATGMVRAKAG